MPCLHSLARGLLHQRRLHRESLDKRSCHRSNLTSSSQWHYLLQRERCGVSFRRSCIRQRFVLSSYQQSSRSDRLDLLGIAALAGSREAISLNGNIGGSAGPSVAYVASCAGNVCSGAIDVAGSQVLGYAPTSLTGGLVVQSMSNSAVVG